MFAYSHENYNKGWAVATHIISMNHSRQSNRNSFNSSMPSEAQIDSYPFAYDAETEIEEIEESLEREEVVPHIGSKIDEIFDSYFEDSIFRIFYPHPLKYSPLTLKFTKTAGYVLHNGFISSALFGQHSTHSWIQLQKIMYQESLLDAGIYTAADIIVDPSNSHKLNRRSVYDAAEKYNNLVSIRVGRLRSIWRFVSHFSIYFIKGVFAGFGMYTTDRFLLPYFQLK